MTLRDEYGLAPVGLLGTRPDMISVNQQLLGVNVPGHAAHTASYMIPGTGLLDSLGFMMAGPGVKGRFGPSLLDSIRNQDYAYALGQGLGTLGDVAQMFPPLIAAGTMIKMMSNPLRATKNISRGVTGGGKTPDTNNILKSESFVDNPTAPGPVQPSAVEPQPGFSDIQMGDPVGDLVSGQKPIRGQTDKELVAMQRAELSPQQLEKINALKTTHPSVYKASRFMLPGEVTQLIGSQKNIEAAERLLDVLPPAKEMTALGKMGGAKRGWYRASTQALVDVFGDDAPRFAALLAATSPQTSVESNLINSLNIWKNWTAAGRPTSREKILDVMGDSVQGEKGRDSILGAWENNTVTALSTANPGDIKLSLGDINLSGAKVDSFMANLSDDVYRFTNDAWMANTLGVEQSLFQGGGKGPPAYHVVSAYGRQVGNSIGLTPREMQETAWTAGMALLEGAKSRGIPVTEMVDKLTRKDILATPDFATLFQLPEYRGILSDAGYGDKVSKLKEFNFPPDQPLTKAERNAALKAAQRLQELAQIRNADSTVKTLTMKDYEAVVNNIFEAVPGQSTGVLTGMVDAPENIRKNYSQQAFKAFTDPRGVDILNKNLGLNTARTLRGTGMYEDGSGITQFNPSANAPTISPVRATSRGSDHVGTIPFNELTKLDAAAALRGGLLAQEGTPYTAIQPLTRTNPSRSETPGEIIIPRDKAATTKSMEEVAKLLPSGTVATDTGKGVGLLNFDGAKQLGGIHGETRSKTYYPDVPPLPRATRDEVTGLLQADQKKPRETVGVEKVGGNYIDMTDEFKQGVGSQAVTKKMFSELDKLPAKDLNKLDNAELKLAAKDLLELNARTAAKNNFPTREDHQNLLRIISEKGLKGLRAAIGTKELLPAIFVLGLGGQLYRQHSGSDS
tara:strand:- start:2730 stop:5450 length:2721 start_codon:yes stop_codon:yes gene_type:complete